MSIKRNLLDTLCKCTEGFCPICRSQDASGKLWRHQALEFFDVPGEKDGAWECPKGKPWVDAPIRTIVSRPVAAIEQKSESGTLSERKLRNANAPFDCGWKVGGLCKVSGDKCTDCTSNELVAGVFRASLGKWPCALRGEKEDKCCGGGFARIPAYKCQKYKKSVTLKACMFCDGKLDPSPLPAETEGFQEVGKPAVSPVQAPSQLRVCKWRSGVRGDLVTCVLLKIDDVETMVAIEICNRRFCELYEEESEN